MHHGNMKFKQKQREEQAEPDGTEGMKLTHHQLEWRSFEFVLTCDLELHWWLRPGIVCFKDGNLCSFLQWQIKSPTSWV